jgi:hypothetical protein
LSKKSFKGGFASLLGEESKEMFTHKQEKSSEQLEKVSTFLVNVNQLQKLKAVAHWERSLIKEVLHDALDDYLTKYEAKNGPISIPPKKS